jgi:hypothetical protein
MSLFPREENTFIFSNVPYDFINDFGASNWILCLSSPERGSGEMEERKWPLLL